MRLENSKAGRKGNLNVATEVVKMEFEYYWHNIILSAILHESFSVFLNYDHSLF